MGAGAGLSLTDFTNMFLDTNIMLDVIENRDRDVKHFVSKLIKRHKKGDIQLSTSIYNITELLDIEFEISFYLECMKEKLSCDVIIRRRNNRDFFYCERAIRNKDKIIEKINGFLQKSELEICTSPLPIEESGILYDLLCDRGIRSQDAIILSCALHNESDYFLSRDESLVKSLHGIIYAFNISKVKDRDTILRTVLT